MLGPWKNLIWRDKLRMEICGPIFEIKKLSLRKMSYPAYRVAHTPGLFDS